MPDPGFSTFVIPALPAARPLRAAVTRLRSRLRGAPGGADAGFRSRRRVLLLSHALVDTGMGYWYTDWAIVDD
ncbi:hypothetical protein [Nocardia sp. NPDC057668]|uniref:hypothetical protein n=1 Tax=Nocardia sp. NPDC057668 TaxID=3346202 RepID=UPI00367113E7